MQPRTCLIAVIAGLLLTGPTPAHAAPVADGEAVVARYSFDGNGLVLQDESGLGHDMRPLATSGARLRPISHGDGVALQFPARCTGQKCPHIVLQSPSTAALNPGLGELAYGASLRLAPGQTSKGQNVLQKGYSKRNSQYKLQVDGLRGRPSCVLVGVGDRRIRRVHSRIGIADGNWHDVSCRRDGSWFTIVVDGRLSGAGRVPALLAVVNDYPLSIGGKGAYRDNDQFQGAIDDVWVRISQ